MSWLGVESVNDMSFSQFDVSGHNEFLGKCSDTTIDSTTGQADLKLTKWKELREQVVLATELDFQPPFQDLPTKVRPSHTA